MTPTSGEPRADRFVRELAELKIPDPATARTTLWLRLGAALMVLGLVLAASAYAITHTTQNPLDQRDGLALGLGGIAATVVGAALFLRYSLTGFLRFWMARQSYDLAVLADRLGTPPARGTTPGPLAPGPLAGKDLNHDLASTDPTAR
ncbi:hypothetical protein ABZ896_25085 [Streptomyces sp. NPDC047072]|uniref:hypothetical protein n=1 Tax=Streptomyces sp. NPDC047072 TaxID=3154809 RepID=UPI0033E7822D